MFIEKLDVVVLVCEMLNVFFYNKMDEVVWFYDEWVKLMDVVGSFNKLIFLVYNLLLYVKFCFGVYFEVMY